MASVEDRARQLLEGRLASVRELVTASQVVTDLEDQLRTAKGRQLTAYRAAEKAGWAPAELRELGFADPTEQPARRPRTRRPSSNRPGPAPVAKGADEESQAEGRASEEGGQ